MVRRGYSWPAEPGEGARLFGIVDKWTLVTFTGIQNGYVNREMT